ncbi:hypothetical protein D9M72_575550 [compost metagenome]
MNLVELLSGTAVSSCRAGSCCVDSPWVSAGGAPSCAGDPPMFEMAEVTDATMPESQALPASRFCQ